MDDRPVMVVETSTTERIISKPQEEIIKEAKRLYENCLYSSKSHFVVAGFWGDFHLWIGIPTVILAGTSGTLAFAEFQYHSTIAGILSIIVVVLTSVATFLNPKERASTHLSAGNNYDSLLTRLRIFWSIDCWRENSEDILTDKLKVFSEERDRLNRECPQPPKWAYKRGKKGIEEGEVEYYVDKE